VSLGKTAWVDKNLQTAWPRIARAVPESWLPRTNIPVGKSKKLTVEELGCGSYGCVMPTGKADLICKLTSDESEAHFIFAYLKLPKPEGGIVRYEKIFELAGQGHRNRPLYVLWRETAYDVGFMRNIFNLWNNKGFDEYELRSLREGEKLISQFLKLARTARESLNRAFKSTVERLPPEAQGEAYSKLLGSVWSAFDNANQESDPRFYKGIPRVGIALRHCYGIAMEMANTYLVDQIGQVLGDYMDHGILLADVHLANIGKNADGQLIITDPGHAVAFHPRWSAAPTIQKI
jgi:hypothetical protein